jgi:hypothetical protein
MSLANSEPITISNTNSVDSPDPVSNNSAIYVSDFPTIVLANVVPNSNSNNCSHSNSDYSPFFLSKYFSISSAKLPPIQKPNFDSYGRPNSNPFHQPDIQSFYLPDTSSDSIAILYSNKGPFE